MSFDLYFLERPPDGDWIEVMDGFEADAASDRGLSPDELAMWDGLPGRVRGLLPDAETFDGDEHRELVDRATGIQLSLHPGGLSLSIPYWYRGAAANDVVEQLVSVVTTVEETTGLTAYDPQAEAPFLDGGAAEAAATFDLIDEQLRDGMATPARRVSWWRRRSR